MLGVHLFCHLQKGGTRLTNYARSRKPGRDQCNYCEALNDELKK